MYAILKADLKKTILCGVLLLSALSAPCFAADGYDITNTVKKDGEEFAARLNPVSEQDARDWLPGYRTLYGRYPVVGRDAHSLYYMDLSSCNYSIDGDIATLGCLIYDRVPGENPNGTPIRAGMTTYQFATFKAADNTRHIILLDAIDNGTGENITKKAVVIDNGFLRNLFWQVARYTGINRYLD